MVNNSISYQQLYDSVNVLKYINSEISQSSLQYLIQKNNIDDQIIPFSVMMQFENRISLLHFLKELSPNIITCYIADHNTSLESCNEIILDLYPLFKHPITVFYDSVTLLLTAQQKLNENHFKTIWSEKNFNYISWDDNKTIINHFWKKFNDENKCLIRFLNRLDYGNQRYFLTWVVFKFGVDPIADL